MDPTRQTSHTEPPRGKIESHEPNHALKKECVESTFFDTDFLQDSKIVEIEDVFGDAAPRYYIQIAFQILREGGPIRYQAAIAILKRTKLADESKKFIDYCVECDLFYRDGNYLSSQRADLEISSLKTKRDKWREKKRRFPKDSPENPRGFQGDSEKEQEKEQELEGENEKEQEEGTGTFGGVQGEQRSPTEPPPNRTRTLEPEVKHPAAAPKPVQKPDYSTDAPYSDEAERALEPLDETTTDGRRRLKKYPLCRITAPKLADALGILIDEYGIPPDKLKLVFRTVNAHLEKAQKRSENVDLKFCVYSLLIGWPAQEVLKTLRESNYHEKSKQSLNGAQRP